MSDNRQAARSAPQSTASGHAAEIERLLARGQVRRALDLAKNLHKTQGNADTEALLVRVYRLRIDEMLRQGLAREAKALADLVSERYPASRGATTAMQEQAAAVCADPLDALARLAAPDLTPQERECIEAVVRCRVTDPRQIADSDRLPPDHPWRQEAAAVARALSAVTAGPITQDQVALPEVARRSPFAPWKMLIRALAHFHALQDVECRQCLAAVAPDSVPARLVAPLQRFLDGQMPDEAQAKLATLSLKVVGDTPRLRRALAALDAAFRSGRSGPVLDAIGNAVRECQRSRPELLVRLRQHIAACAVVVDMPPDKVRSAMGAASIKDAYFWRLFARSLELRAARDPATGSTFNACAAWEEFRRHAVHQRWFAAGSAEEAALFLHLIELLERVPWHESAWDRDEFVRGFVQSGGLAHYYRAAEQPPGVMACRPPRPPATYFVFPDVLYARACTATPTPELFQRWLTWTKDNELGPRAEDDVAEAWHRACPDDPRPLLLLMENAEARDALGKALKYLTAAEALDTLNVEVRRARSRLLVATAVRHLGKRQRHLVEKDLANLAALPPMAEGDRPVLLAALRWLATALLTQPAPPMLAMEELATIAGNRLTACFLLYQLAFASKNAALERALVAHLTAADLDSPRCLSAAARVLLLCEEMHLRFGLPVPWVGALEVAVRRGDGNLTEPQLRGLATYAVNSRLPKGATLSVSLAPLAYGLAGHGLRRPDADQARFLLVRGKSLLIEDALAPQRGLECLRAARMLAARRRDMTLVEEAMSLERRYGYHVRSFPFEDDHDADHLNLLSAEALERLLAAERQALEFPARQAPAAIPLRTPSRPSAPQSRDDRRQGYLPGLEVLDATADDAPLGPGPETDGLDIFRALEDLEAPDEPGDSDGNGEPFDDLPPELAPAILAAMAKLYRKYGNGALGLVQDLDRLARKEPQIFAELMAACEASTLGHAGASLPFPFPPRRRGRR